MALSLTSKTGISKTGISKAVILIGLLGTCVAFAGQDMNAADEKKNPLAGQKAAIELGQQRFKSGCAACHGADAGGGRGPALAGNRDLQSMTDQQIFDTIRHGIAGTSMPPSQMPDDQTWQLAAFVRNLSSPAAQAFLPGNSVNGRVLFFGKAGCSQCHAIRGTGGSLGPDLTDAGANLTAKDLRESILQPSARIAEGFGAAVVTLQDGERIEGAAKDNTNYSISIVDRSGRLHLLNKADVSRIEFKRESLMPEDIGQRLRPEELEDILSFVASQTARPAAESAGERRGRERVH